MFTSSRFSFYGQLLEQLMLPYCTTFCLFSLLYIVIVIFGHLCCLNLLHYLSTICVPYIRCKCDVVAMLRHGQFCIYCSFQCCANETSSFSDVGLVSVKCSGCQQCIPRPVYCRKVVHILIPYHRIISYHIISSVMGKS